MKSIPVITGATASGKSALAIALAKQSDGVIINADSMQIYNAAPLLTAQPDAAEQNDAPHSLYGILEPDDPCSAARWCGLCVEQIQIAQSHNKTPIIVGGTGLYVKSLISGLSIIPDIDETIRNYIRSLPKENLHSMLQQADADMAAELKPHDTQRISRALEVIQSTGKSLRYWQSQPVTVPLPDASFTLFSCTWERQVLYERINRRYDIIINKGGLEEARLLHEKGLDRELPLCRAVGVRELLDYFDGTLSHDDAVQKAKTNSRRYAKRQITWMSHQYETIYALDMQQSLDSLVDIIVTHIAQ